MAAVVVTGTKLIDPPQLFGQKRVVAFTLTLDTGDYASGGFALPNSVLPAAFGMSSFDVVLIQPTGLNATGTYLPSWNSTTQKVVLFDSAANDTPFQEQAVEALVASSFLVFAIGA